MEHLFQELGTMELGRLLPFFLFFFFVSESHLGHVLTILLPDSDFTLRLHSISTNCPITRVLHVIAPRMVGCGSAYECPSNALLLFNNFSRLVL